MDEVLKENEQLRALCRRTTAECLRLKKSVRTMQNQITHLQSMIEEFTDEEKMIKDMDRLVSTGNEEMKRLRSLVCREDQALARLTVCITALQKKLNVSSQFATPLEKRTQGEAPNSLLISLVDELQYTLMKI
eukprot:PhF_6_TR37768/c0_g1_i1/m.56231